MFRILVVVAVILAISFSYMSDRQEHREAVARNNNASATIVLIESLNTPETSKLATELRDSYPDPTDADVLSLQQLYVRLKADPKSAAKYTVEAKRADMKASHLDQLQSVVSGETPLDTVKPGI